MLRGTTFPTHRGVWLRMDISSTSLFQRGGEETMAGEKELDLLHPQCLGQWMVDVFSF